MTISISPQKADAVIEKLKNLISNNNNTLRDLASVLGTIISVIPATSYGKLHYRTTEKFKISELKKAKGYFNVKLVLIPEDVIAELNWWKNNVGKHHLPIYQPEIDLQLETDASEGWGQQTTPPRLGADGTTLLDTALSTLKCWPSCQL